MLVFQHPARNVMKIADLWTCPLMKPWGFTWYLVGLYPAFLKRHHPIADELHACTRAANDVKRGGQKVWQIGENV